MSLECWQIIDGIGGQQMQAPTGFRSSFSCFSIPNEPCGAHKAN